MSTLVIKGDITDLFVHCTALGLAAIVEETTGQGVLIKWIDQNQVQVISENGLDDKEMTGQVITFTKRSLEAKWPEAEITFKYADKSGKQKEAAASPLSPKVNSSIETNEEGLLRYKQGRMSAMQLMDNNLLSQIALNNLGSPAYWAMDNKGHFNSSKVDVGLSPWAMSDTRRGDDFVRSRLKPVCQLVSKIENNESAIHRLCGDRCKDELNQQKLLSQSTSATGLRMRGPADTLQLWCALHAFVFFPIRSVVSYGHSLQSNAIGAITIQNHSRRSIFFCLPIFSKPTYIEHIRSTLRSRPFYEKCKYFISQQTDSNAQKAQMRKSDYQALALFPRVAKYDASYTEYWADYGQLFNLSN